MGTKKPADPGGRAGARGEPRGLSQGWSRVGAERVSGGVA
jgi:hypothetical protein